MKELNEVEIRTGKLALALLLLTGALALLNWWEAFDIPLWGILAPMWAPFIVGLILSAFFGLLVKFRK